MRHRLLYIVPILLALTGCKEEQKPETSAEDVMMFLMYSADLKLADTRWKKEGDRYLEYGPADPNVVGRYIRIRKIDDCVYESDEMS